MKIYMIWDYLEKDYWNHGYFRPYCFSTYEKAEEFLMEPEETFKFLSKKGNKYIFYNFEDNTKATYEIFAVEIDKVNY